MERMGEIIKRNQGLTSQSNDGKTTAIVPSKNSGLWYQKLIAMAQDMRQDLAPGMLSYWKQELKSYSDDEILVALGLYVGEFFPSVKQIREILERKRQLANEQKRLGEWDRWKAVQKAAEAEGKLATAEEIDAMLAGCKRAWERVVNGDNNKQAQDRSGMDQSNIMGLEESATSARGSSDSIKRQIECVSNKSTENLGRSEGTKA